MKKILVFLIVVFITVVGFSCALADSRQLVGSTDIDVSGMALKKITTGTTKEMLFRHLASSAEWFVTIDNGALTAIKRGRDAEGTWSTTLNGYITDFGSKDVLQTRVAITLEEPNKNHLYSIGRALGLGAAATAFFQRNHIVSWHSIGRAGENDIVKLKMYKPSFEQPGIESWLELNTGSSLSLEVFEQAKNTDRKFTKGALQEVNSLIKNILASKTAPITGFDPSLLPAGSMKISKPVIAKIDDGFQRGIYKVRAYLNPGAKGYVYLKVINMQTKEEVLLSMEQLRTMEYIGWSDNPSEKFFYCVEAMSKVGDWEHEYPASFEFWFQPSDGSPKRLLHTMTRKIYGWER